MGVDVSDRRGCVKGFLGEWTGKKETRVIRKGREHTGTEREIYSMPRLKALGKLCKIAAQ